MTSAGFLKVGNLPGPFGEGYFPREEFLCLVFKVATALAAKQKGSDPRLAGCDQGFPQMGTHCPPALSARVQIHAVRGVVARGAGGQAEPGLFPVLGAHPAVGVAALSVDVGSFGGRFPSLPCHVWK